MQRRMLHTAPSASLASHATPSASSCSKTVAATPSSWARAASRYVGPGRRLTAGS